MLNETSLAAAVGASVRNKQFAPGAQNVPRKILIIGTGLAANALPANVPVRVLSPADVGARAGWGSMLHRLAIQTFKGGQGVETFMVPQDENGVAAAGILDFGLSNNVAAGTIALYIAYERVAVVVAAGATPAQIATAVVAAVNARKELPVTAAVDGEDPAKVNVTSKSQGPWGNNISLLLNLGAGEVLPGGVQVVVTSMRDGAGVPSITDALAALGTGDSANEEFFTDVVHGYGPDATTLDAILAYVGQGNEASGLYSKTVARPFRALTGDVAAGGDGLNALITLSSNRKLDRANGIVAVPGSASHPSEIAAQVIGHMARVNQNIVAQHYLGIALIGVHTGAVGDRWTDEYDNRDIAVKGGVSPTRVRSGQVYLQNMVTFYRPDDVPVESNGYRSMRNVCILQNMLASVRATFDQEEWQGIIIVADATKVSSMVDRAKVRDVDAVINTLMALVNAWERKGWVYEAAYTINKLKQGLVQIRPGGLGFNSALPVLLSGEGGILDTTVEFDTSLAVVLNQ